MLHAFQKESTRGIATPKPEIDRVPWRLKHLQQARADHAQGKQR